MILICAKENFNLEDSLELSGLKLTSCPGEMKIYIGQPFCYVNIFLVTIENIYILNFLYFAHPKLFKISQYLFL